MRYRFPVEPGSRRPSAYPWSLITALALVTAIAAYDLVAPAPLAVYATLAVGPCLAAVSAGPWGVTATGGYVLLLIALLSWLRGLWASPQQVVYLLITLLVTAISAVTAGRRRALRARAEQGARDRAMLAAIVESSEDAILAMTPDGTITAWNPGAERMYGYPATEAIGRNVSMIMPPDQAAELPDILRRAAGGELIEHYDTRHVRRDGGALDVSVGIAPLRDPAGRVIGCSATARDISARKHAERNRARLAAIVECSHDAIIAKSLDGTITAWNPGAERMYGYPATEAIGRNVSMIMPPDEAAELPDIRDRLGRGQPIVERAARRVRRDGTPVDVSVTMSPIRDETGVVVGASVTARDITAQKRAEAHERQLRERSHQAERLQSIGQLAGGIAHDFNNLLAVILNYAGFVAEATAGDEAVQADVARIRVAAERAGQLTRQLLTFARREPTHPQVIDLNAAIADAQRLLARTLGEHIEMVIVPSPEPLRIRADRGQVEQVLLNLALNARDAMPGGGTLVIEASASEFDEPAGLVPGPGRYARLLVSDTGVGMTSDVAARIFEPFYSTKPRGQGTGLGLATVYGIVAESGGTIRVYSEPNVGTTMRMYLPAVDESEPVEPAAGAVPAAEGDGRCVLVV